MAGQNIQSRDAGNGLQSYNTTQTIGEFSVTMSIAPGPNFQCQWSPHMPQKGELTHDQLQQFRQARNGLLAHASKQANWNGLQLAD